MTLFSQAIAAFGLLGAVWTIALTIPTMGRRHHRTALWVLAAGIGITSISTLLADPGSPLDVQLNIEGDGLVVAGMWLIILTRGADRRAS